MYYVGIDWADENHQVFITDDSAQRLGAFSIENSRSGVRNCLKESDILSKTKNKHCLR